MTGQRERVRSRQCFRRAPGAWFGRSGESSTSRRSVDRGPFFLFLCSQATGHEYASYRFTQYRAGTEQIADI
ncbi:hypothetical protein AADR41_16675 [Streptomyces sp. CLV115]|uniref:hypothetical protein n=1 Tax=Streptomyces sp. CLV115 TaxID=3138502 RepID=UPI00313D2957